MAETPSAMLDLGTRAPSFSLPDTAGKQVSLDDFKGAPALLVVFMCNHCPYVKHLQHSLAAFVREYEPKGLAAVGINANDIISHPGDSPEKMAEEVKSVGYTFPYLYDESQAVAKNYRAACTPDFFLFDSAQRLVYRGQYDGSRPGNDVPVSGEDLRAATDAILSGGSVASEQKPSVGCNIKWRPGHEPSYFG